MKKILPIVFCFNCNFSILILIDDDSLLLRSGSLPFSGEGEGRFFELPLLLSEFPMILHLKTPHPTTNS